MTSTLLGIALEEGKIKSVNDPVVKYLPGLSASGFKRVTLKDALEMATGLELTYDPYDPHSSTLQFNTAVPVKFIKPADEKQGLGYGYQWWIPTGSDHAFKALGILGQIIYINPTKHIVIVETSAWPTPEDDMRWAESSQVMDAIVADVSH